MMTNLLKLPHKVGTGRVAINLYFPLLGKKFNCRVRNLKFATYLKFATCENTNKINELW